MKKKITLATFILINLTGSVYAQEVPINDVLPVLATKKVTEQPSNVWFLLDDSGSMSAGVGFNINGSYPLPLDVDGQPFPEPANNRIFLDPFLSYANNGNFSNFPIAFDFFCSSFTGTVRTNCLRYRSYYRNRMLSLKSSFSIAMDGIGRTDTIRWGFDTFWQRNNRQIMPRDIQSSRTALYNTIFEMAPSFHTPLRHRFSELVRSIRSLSSLNPSAGQRHPDLFDVENGFDANTNPVLSCRRNHTVLLTDGGWNGGNQGLLHAGMIGSGFVNGAAFNSYTRSNGLTLPDGMTYRRYRPFFQASPPGFPRAVSVADIAFAAWANDLNNDSSDNTLLMSRPRLPDENGNEVYYSNDVVSGSGTIPASLQSVDPDTPITEGHYWHPYNDPASWQHINTHTIAFGLGTANIPDVNPPRDSADAVAKRSYFRNIDKYISGSANFVLPNSIDRIDNFPIMAINDMARAAVAGRGEFHSVVTPQGLTRAFQSIFGAISKNNAIGSSVNRGSAAAVASATVGSSQTLFTANFNPNTFAGEVLALPVYDGTQSPSDCWVEPQLSQNTDSNGDVLPSVGAGTFCNNEAGAGAWKASDSINSTNFNARNVVTSSLEKVDGDEIDTLAKYIEKAGKGKQFKLKAEKFEFGNLKAYRKNTSNGTLDQSSVDYIRGDDQNEVRNGGGFRNRVKTTGSSTGWLLGDIGRSAPVYVSSKPTISNDHVVLRDTTARDAFSKFRKRTRTDMVYFGSNDGMLHGLDATPSSTSRTDREQFAYVPHILFDKLPKLTKADEHNSFVDGKISVETVYEKKGQSETDWHLRLVSGLGSGDKGLFSLDVSYNMKSFNDFKKALPWEYGEKDSQAYNAKNNNPGKSNIGNILARPGIVQVRNKSDASDSAWVVAVGNGYNAESNKAALILLDVFTGEIIQELVLDTSQNDNQHKKYIDNSKTNGLGPLFFLSYEGKNLSYKYQVDRAYAGDLQGNLWVFDFSELDIKKCREATTKENKKKHCVKVASEQFDSNNVIPLFTAVDKNGKRQPITVAPLVEEHPTGFGYLVHFGTGALFDRVDLSLFEKGDPTTPIVNSIYAIWDDWVPFGVGKGSGLETPKKKPITFVRNSQSALRELKWSRNTVQNSNGDPIEVRTLARDSQDASPKTTWAFGAENTDPNGHLNKRGWFIDLDPRERAWQRPFVAFGENNIRSISYVTTTYPDGAAASGTPTCSTSTEAPFSWTVAFDPDDGSQLLTGSGTIDTNLDGRVCAGCAKNSANGLKGDPIKDGLGSGSPIAVTGIKSVDVLLSNANPTPTPPGQGLNSCPGLMQITSNANNSGNSQAVACRPLLPSSWQELK